MDIVLVSTADWDNPFWTNKQHVAMELSKLGHRILYIESLGLRRPTASTKDVFRIFRRLFRALRPPRKVNSGLWVWSPIIIPNHSSTRIRALNKVWLQTQLSLWLAFLRFKRDIIWTYLPLTTGLLNIKRYDQSVYHNVDNIASQPGMPSAVINALERDLLAQVDCVFCTAPKLVEKSIEVNASSFFYPNVVDCDHFSKSIEAESVPPADLAAIPNPRIGFVGAISAYKVDFDLIREVAAKRPQFQFVLIGQVGEGEPLTKIDTLRGLPNVHLLGPRSYSALPAYMHGMDAAMLPNLINDYTESMFPMKFFEYLAADLPVVGTRLAALKGYEDVAAFCTTADEFATGLDRALAGSVGTSVRRKELASQWTYRARTLRMLEDMARLARQKGLERTV